VDWTDLRIGTICGQSRRGYVTFGCDKIRGISWLAEELMASQQGLFYVELVSGSQLEI